MRISRVGAAVALLAIGAAVSLPGAAEAQCAMCRTALDSPEGRKLIAAFQSGVLLLLAVPFATFGTVAWLAIRGQRQLRQAQRDGESAPEN